MSAAAVAESRSDPSDDDRLRRRLDLQDERLSREEARFETIKEDAYRRIDILKEAGTEARRLLNVHISDTMTGQWRGKDRFRCGESHQEIGHVAVCDGVVDCKNGVDELNETCVNPVVVGSIWKGYTVYNHCNGDSIHRLTVKILNAVRPHWFSAFVQIRAEAHVYRVIDDAVIERRHSIYGAYSFGSRVLFVHSPRTLTSRLVVLAQFDGTSTTRCYGYEVRQVTMETCAEYRFFRVE
ncbi:hypothetical protein LSAT2_011697 [Lamellibrachia satsuma]|nr:hypothetical protein LSAT2_011697 [Lamellibrachia satsuma]